VVFEISKYYSTMQPTKVSPSTRKSCSTIMTLPQISCSERYCALPKKPSPTSCVTAQIRPCSCDSKDNRERDSTCNSPMPVHPAPTSTAVAGPGCWASKNVHNSSVVLPKKNTYPSTFVSLSDCHGPMSLMKQPKRVRPAVLRFRCGNSGSDSRRRNNDATKSRSDC